MGQWELPPSTPGQPTANDQLIWGYNREALLPLGQTQ